jgi:hypothetical protein
MTPEHAVIINFYYGFESMDKLVELEYRLRSIISEKGVGEYDGHDIALDHSDGTLYMYGPNAEKLFLAIKETLEKTDFMKGEMATLRFGPPEEGVKEIDVEI